MKKEDFEIANYLLASKLKRFLNFIIDAIIIMIIVRVVIQFLNILEISNTINSFDRIERYLFWSGVSFVYYGITESFFSRSPAKYLTKTIVVMADGSKPTLMVILVRTIFRILPLEPLSFLRGRALGLHDENSRTFVVIKSKFEMQMKEHFELLSLDKS
ncbi:RDD family protein [Flavobacterium reichenbachii]|uniref:RDD family protein n=1 Tax=Flavobacterium reichenbachii TaxID=362418 RepID=UPI00069185DC|nr:RDD family protein [Flavobacterium reichenbachii]OXB18447.1 hypothetical protein B0A68_00020 [Flavobacterium reichenbachii]